MNYIQEPWEVGFGNPVRPYVIAVIELKHMPEFPNLYLDPRHTITAGNPTGGGPFFTASMGEETARRIVACVNACQGFPTEFLEALGTGGI